MNTRPITKENPYKLCFVCLGNICRSPTAEGIFQHLVNERGLQPYFYVDSSGTSAYHIGEPANSKSQWVANQQGVQLHSKARRFDSADLEEFDLILAMDSENFRNISQSDKNGTYSDKIRMMREFDPQHDDRDVPDPYYGGMDGFQIVFDVLKRSCNELLNRLEPLIEKSS
ncbi:MAG: low molecular weight phosphotyrosine protein phosphatase [Balneolaceae bacterium]|nr:low molecular weight phosphotyrosine protein phosphatase [Balneolaceae bacterium]